MNTQPDQARELEEKPRLRVETCQVCRRLFTQAANRRDTICNHCSGRFENDFARIFGNGRR